jgi:hypothetical protein
VLTAMADGPLIPLVPREAKGVGAGVPADGAADFAPWVGIAPATSPGDHGIGIMDRASIDRSVPGLEDHTMKRLIALTEVGKGAVHVNPDQIVMIEPQPRGLAGGAKITLATGPGALIVAETVDQVVELVDSFDSAGQSPPRRPPA